MESSCATHCCHGYHPYLTASDWLLIFCHYTNVWKSCLNVFVWKSLYYKSLFCNIHSKSPLSHPVQKDTRFFVVAGSLDKLKLTLTNVNEIWSCRIACSFCTGRPITLHICIHLRLKFRADKENVSKMYPCQYRLEWHICIRSKWNQ